MGCLGIGGHQLRFMGARMEDREVGPKPPHHTEELYDVATRLVARGFSETRLQRLHPHNLATSRLQGGTQEVTWRREGSESTV